MKQQRDLSFWKLWNLSFGFFGVQIAYALQSSQVSRIFSTIGADPHDLSYFWILPPLMGLMCSPLWAAPPTVHGPALAAGCHICLAEHWWPS